MGALAARKADFFAITMDDPGRRGPGRDRRPDRRGRTQAGGRFVVELDRRAAIRRAVRARAPRRRGAAGGQRPRAAHGRARTKTPWNDARVAAEVLAELGFLDPGCTMMAVPPPLSVPRITRRNPTSTASTAHLSQFARRRALGRRRRVGRTRRHRAAARPRRSAACAARAAPRVPPSRPTPASTPCWAWTRPSPTGRSRPRTAAWPQHMGSSARDNQAAQAAERRLRSAWQSGRGAPSTTAQRLHQALVGRPPTPIRRAPRTARARRVAAARATSCSPITPGLGDVMVVLTVVGLAVIAGVLAHSASVDQSVGAERAARRAARLESVPPPRHRRDRHRRAHAACRPPRRARASRRASTVRPSTSRTRRPPRTRPRACSPPAARRPAGRPGSTCGRPSITAPPTERWPATRQRQDRCLGSGDDHVQHRRRHARTTPSRSMCSPRPTISSCPGRPRFTPH